MEVPPPVAPTRRGREIAAGGLIVAIGLALYLPGLGREILRHPLEAKYALVARDMLRGGPMLVPHVFGEPFPDKPPLYFWVTATLGWLNGGDIDEVTARLPAAAAALAGLLLVYRLGTELFGPRAGLLSALILATSNLSFWYARQGHPDQFLTTFVTLACLGLWRGFTATTRRGAAGWMAVAYGGMALGVLSKGLIGLIVPLLAGTAYLLAIGPARALPPRLRLLPGLGVFLAVALAWYGPAVAHYGRSYLYETLIHQHFVRYARTWSHAGPWYYYLGEFPAGFFPWVLFLPGAIVLGWRARGPRPGQPEETAAPAVPGLRPFFFPLGWFATGFVFFSLATGKRGAYLLPLYPAAALMVGWLWDRTLGGRTPTRWTGIPLGMLSGAAALLAVGLALVPRRFIPGRMVDTLVPADPRQLTATILLLLGGAAIVWLLSRRGPAAAVSTALVAIQSVLLLAVATIRAPQYEARYPIRDFAARVRAAVPPGQPVLSLLEDYDNIVDFYLHRPFLPIHEPADLLAARDTGKPRYALVDGDDLARLTHPGVRALEETRLGPKRVVLIRLDPGP